MWTFEVVTNSEEQTRALGCQLGRAAHAGDLIGLYGELGAGKTTLVRGLADGLGIPASRVRSPTFTLINEYTGGRLPLYHIDLYRMQPTEMDRLTLREYLYGEGVCVVEWMERLGEEAEALEVTLTFVGESQRRLLVRARDQRYGAFFDLLRNG